MPTRAAALDKRQTAIPIILARLAGGESMNAICSSQNMPDRVTVKRWCNEDRALADQIYEARETGFMDRAEKAVEAAKTAVDPQLGRLAFDAERWYLGKLSNAFAERPARIESQTNVQVNVDGDPFGRFAELMDSAAASLAASARRTTLVVGEREAGSDSP